MNKIDNSQGIRKERSKAFIFIILFLILGASILINRFAIPGVEKATITSWYDGHTAAYSIIHDDLCLDDCYGIIEFADTMAFNRNIRVAMGASVAACSAGGDTLWPKLKGIVSRRHEIISHGWGHTAAVDLGWTPEDWDYHRDMLKTKTTIESNVPGAAVNFFIFPYDAYNEQRLAELKKAGYLGARAGRAMYQDRGVNRFGGAYDPYRTMFDAYMSKDEQDEINASDNPYTTSIYNDDSLCVAVQHMEAAIESRGWSLQEMHSVDDQSPRSWGQISVEDYKTLLDHAVRKRDAKDLWIDTPTNVAKYVMTRNSLEGILKSGKQLRFKSQPKDERYNTAVTLKLETRNEPDSLIVYQGDRRIVAEKRAENLFFVNTDRYDDMMVVCN